MMTRITPTGLALCLAATLGAAPGTVGAQTLAQVEQRWAGGERRQLLPALRTLRPSLSGPGRDRADYMLSYMLCEGNDLAERQEGFAIARGIRTLPRPPWTDQAAGRIERLRRWCSRPVTPSRTVQASSAPPRPLVVLNQDWTGIRVNDKALSLRALRELGGTELAERLSDAASAVRIFREQPAGTAPIECEEQVTLVARSESTAEGEEDGVLCLQGLWTQNGRVIHWEGDPTLPAGWEEATLAELPPAGEP